MKSIYAAFVSAQAGFAPALKSSTNPHFKSKYADLSAVVEAVIDALHKNGIGLMQKTHLDESGVTVETVLIHSSGESIECGKLHVPASKQDPQGYGSAMTYARRYSLMAACGIAPEDDDGNAAVKAKAHESALERDLKASIAANRARRDGELDERALDMIESFHDSREGETVKLWFDDGEFFKNADEKAYVWGLLRAEPTLRALLQANDPNRDHKPKPAVEMVSPGPGLKKIGKPITNGATQ